MNQQSHSSVSQFIRPVAGQTNSAFCTRCNREFSLSSMGAMLSPANMVWHRMEKQNVLTLKSSYASTSSTSMDLTQASGHNETATMITTSTSSASLTQEKIETFMIRDDVLKSELQWVLHSIDCHDSFRRSDNNALVSRRCSLTAKLSNNFPWAEIKWRFRPPLDYSTILSKAMGGKTVEMWLFCCSLCFDESLNEKSQHGQMDLYVRYWDEERHEVTTSYFNSAFLGRTTAQHIIVAFKEGLHPLPLTNIFQISMDGPSVN